MVKKCVCKHEVQDELYGKGNRLHVTDKKGVDHCTVCGGDSANIKRLKTHASMWQPIHGGKK